MTSSYISRPESTTYSTTTTTTFVNPGELVESRMTSQARLTLRRRAIDQYIKPVLDLHNPDDDLPSNYGDDVYTYTYKEDLKRAAIIDEGACLIRNSNLRSKSAGRRYGEVQVTFYNYGVIQEDNEDLEDVEDEEDYFSDSITTQQKREIERRMKRKLVEQRRRSLIQAAKKKGDSYELLPLQYLYERESETAYPQMQYECFPADIKETSGVKIIEFPACYYAREFLETMQDHNNRDKFSDVDPQGVLKSRNLQFSKHNPGFKTGVSLRATCNDTDRDYLTLLAAIPYLGKPPRMNFERDARLHPENVASCLTEYRPVGERESWRRESLSLSEYRFLGPYIGKGSIRHKGIKNELKEERYADQEVIIHQAWFMVLDNYTMAIFRSSDDQLSNRNPHPPLYPYQDKIGAFHALVHAISNILDNSDKILLDTYRAKVSELEYGYQSLIKDEHEDENEDESSDEDDYRRTSSKKRKMVTGSPIQENPKDLARAVEKVITQISTISSVVQSQIQILKDLREIFRLSIGLESRRPQGGIVQIPIMSDQKEQVRIAEGSLTSVIEERHRFSEKLDVLFKDMKSISRSLAGKGTEESMARQAHTMSMLTLVTTLFLPLGFFSSYAALDPIKLRVKTRAQFWRLSGPVTAAFMISALTVIIHKKGRTKRFIQRLALLRVKLMNILLKYKLDKTKSRSQPRPRVIKMEADIS